MAGFRKAGRGCLQKVSQWGGGGAAGGNVWHRECNGHNFMYILKKQSSLDLNVRENQSVSPALYSFSRCSNSVNSFPSCDSYRPSTNPERSKLVSTMSTSGHVAPLKPRHLTSSSFTFFLPRSGKNTRTRGIHLYFIATLAILTIIPLPHLSIFLYNKTIWDPFCLPSQRKTGWRKRTV